jgi:hypothetical protein
MNKKKNAFFKRKIFTLTSSFLNSFQEFQKNLLKLKPDKDKKKAWVLFYRGKNNSVKCIPKKLNFTRINFVRTKDKIYHDLI